MKLSWAFLMAFIVMSALALAAYFAPGHKASHSQGLLNSGQWQRMVNPGELSQAHAFLDYNCQACHSPVKGVESNSCTVCHSTNDWVLQRQPTAFHANVEHCQDCHMEHNGRNGFNTRMDHDRIAEIGLEMMEDNSGEDEEVRIQFTRLRRWISEFNQLGLESVAKDSLSSKERTLNCFVCHENDDRHLGQFGNSCSSCHVTNDWSIPEYRHPPANSLDCSQCHQAPPSHYMKHFNMISATVAGKPHARVDQCYACHQNTSWNDIKRVGRYKHH